MRFKRAHAIYVLKRNKEKKTERRYILHGHIILTLRAQLQLFKTLLASSRQMYVIEGAQRNVRILGSKRHFYAAFVTSVFARNVISSVSLRSEYETISIQLCRGLQKCKKFDIIYYFCLKYRLWTCYPEKKKQHFRDS